MGLHPFNPAKWRFIRNYRLAVANLIAIVLLKEQESKITTALADIRTLTTKVPSKKQTKKSSVRKILYHARGFQLEKKVKNACGLMIKELQELKKIDMNDFTLDYRAASHMIRFYEGLKKSEHIDVATKNHLVQDLARLKGSVQRKKLEMNNLLTNVTNLMKLAEKVEPLPSWWIEHNVKKHIIETGGLVKNIKIDEGKREVLFDYNLLSKDLSAIAKETSVLTRRLLSRFRRLGGSLAHHGFSFSVIEETDKAFKKVFKKIKKVSMIVSKDLKRKTAAAGLELVEHVEPGKKKVITFPVLAKKVRGNAA